MAIYALTGNDTLIINGKVIGNLTDNSTVELSFENDRVGSSTGKNDNTVFADNRQGGNATVTLRVLSGSKDDIWFNGMSIKQDNDLPSFPLMFGSFTKRIGDGFGVVRFNNYVLEGGVFKKFIDTQENLVGETEQGTAVYTIFFAKAKRAIG